MSSGISIDIAADTKPFVTNVNAMADALEQAAAQLDRLATSGNGPDEISVRLKEEAQNARLTAEQLRTLDQQMSDTRAAVLQPANAFQTLSERSAQARTQLRDVGTTAVESGREVSEGGKVGEAALMNLGYTSLSAGSLFSGPGGVLQNLGTFLAFMGPAALGNPALAVGLTGVGVALAAIAGVFGDGKVDEETQKLQENIKSLSDQFLSFDQIGQRSVSDMYDSLKALADGSDANNTSLDELKRTATALHEPLEQVASAYIQGGAALDQLITKSKSKYKADYEAYVSGQGYSAKEIQDLHDQAVGLDGTISKLEKQKEAYDKAREAQILALEAGADKYDVQVQQIQDISQAWDDVRSAAVDAATADDNSFNTGTWEAEVEKRGQLVLKLQDYYQQVKLTPDEWINLLALPTSAQEAILTSYSTGDSAAKKRIRDDLSDGGKEAGSAAAVSFSTSFQPKVDAVKVNVDDTEAKKTVKKLTEHQTVTITADTSKLRGQIQSALNSAFNINVKYGRVNP